MLYPLLLLFFYLLGQVLGINDGATHNKDRDEGKNRSPIEILSEHLGKYREFVNQPYNVSMGDRTTSLIFE